MDSAVRYLKRAEIDLAKWDERIDRSANGLIYAYSFYLDTVARHWDALVWGDYEYLMPLTWNRKYGLFYLYQPLFAASLGIFGDHISEAMVREFVHAIPKKFRLTEIDFNHSNPPPSDMNGFFLRHNYVLRLSQSYETIQAGYRDNTRRNIRKAVQIGCRYQAGIPLEDVIQLCRQHFQKIAHVPEEEYARFRQLYEVLYERKQALTAGILGPDGMLLSSCVFFFSHGRAYYILVGNHPNGKTLGASHYLIDSFIQQQAGQSLVLDFEGSDIRNLAFFYTGFGAVEELYPALRVNHLPWWARIWKR